MTPLSLLILEISPSLEDVLADWLLESGLDLEFEVQVVHARATAESGLTLLEQVSGRRKRIRLDVVGTSSAIQALILALKEEFAGADIRYTRIAVEERARL